MSTIKLLVVGRTATGKDTFRHALEKLGMTFVKSSTTREKRYPGEDTHVFLTHEEADAIPASEKVAVTHINNGAARDDEYFATKTDVMNHDAYIIDPVGVKMLLKNMPDTQFGIIYLQADKKAQKMHALCRVAPEDRKAELEKFEDRYRSEDAQFTEFEKWYNSAPGTYRNVYPVCNIINPYRKEYFTEKAEQIYELTRMHERLVSITKECLSLGILHRSETGKVIVYTRYGVREMMPEEFASVLLTDREGFSRVIHEWLLRTAAVNIS